MPTKQQQPVPFRAAMIPVVAVAIFLGIGTFLCDAEPHFPIFLGGAVAGLVAIHQGYSWQDIENGIKSGINRALPALLILLVIGMLIGTWVASGVIPALTYYGSQILAPTWFLPAILVLTSLMALVTGSSWTAAGTVGIAAIAMGQGFDIPAAAVAGAVVSGSFFGDKISPLSDSTNLTASVTDVELYTHIKHMLYTTLPAFLVALVLYSMYGVMVVGDSTSPDEIQRLQETLAANFLLSPLLFVPPFVVIALIVLKIPAIPALLTGTLVGGLLQMGVQGQSIDQVLDVIYHGYSIDTGWDMADRLLSRGGMSSMYSTVSLGLIALAFGGIMNRCEMLSSIVGKITGLVKTQGNLTLTTLITAFFINVFGANQYLSVIIPGQMFQGSYGRLGLHRKNLSRNLEAGGTLLAPLIPWNSSGVFMYTVLAVNPLSYAPFALLCWLTPVVATAFGYTGVTIATVPVVEDDLQPGEQTSQPQASAPG